MLNFLNGNWNSSVFHQVRISVWRIHLLQHKITWNIFFPFKVYKLLLSHLMEILNNPCPGRLETGNILIWPEKLSNLFAWMTDSPYWGLSTCLLSRYFISPRHGLRSKKDRNLPNLVEGVIPNAVLKVFWKELVIPDTRIPKSKGCGSKYNSLGYEQRLQWVLNSLTSELLSCLHTQLKY